MDFTNDADMIWINTNNRISLKVFALYYELFKNITEYSELDIDKEEFKKVYYLAFFKYLKNIDRNITDYNKIFDGFLNCFSTYYDNNEFKEIVNLYKEDVNNIDDSFPWINIINNLNLSYENKVCINILISDYLANTFSTLNGIYNEIDRDIVFDNISSNVLNFINNDNIQNFDVNIFRDKLLYFNKKNINSLINEGIFDINNIDIDVSYLDKDEFKILIHYIKTNLIGGVYNPIIGYKEKTNDNELKMSKLKYMFKSKSLVKKVNKYMNN